MNSSRSDSDSDLLADKRFIDEENFSRIQNHIFSFHNFNYTNFFMGI